MDPRTPGNDAAPLLALRSRFLTQQTLFAIDLAVMVAAFALSYLLRFDFDVPPEYVQMAISQLPLVLAAQSAALYLSGAPSFVWRFIGIAEVPAFARAAGWSAALLLLLRFTVPVSLPSLRVALSIIFMNALTAFGGMLGVRVLRRAWLEHSVRRRRPAGNGRRPAVLLVGAGAAGVMAAREIRSHGDQDLDLRGFVDDDPLQARRGHRAG